MASIAILHGWSDKGKSFAPFRDFLGANGFAVQDIFLGDYISMDDDVRVEDVAKRMEAVVEALLASGRLKTPFDLVVHSTGALVARQWMVDRLAAGREVPVRRFLMLAPANFGSKLAAVGKSMIGRLTKGLGNRLETGEEMLRALELASPYQWRLSQRDLLAAPGAADKAGPYRRDGVWPFVIIGTRAYDSGAQQIINENGSDGTVRVCAGNINAVGVTIDFTPEGSEPTVTPWRPRMEAPAPFAVLPERDHSEITRPWETGEANAPWSGRLGQLVLQALNCASYDAYKTLAADWQAISDETASLATDKARRDAVFQGHDNPDADHFHRYLQLNVMVRDDYGNLVDDYFLEFRQPDTRTAKSMVDFHKDVLEAVHVNSVSGAYRCLYVDHTDLIDYFYGQQGHDALAVSLSAAAPGRNIKYFDSRVDNARGEIRLHAASDQAKQDIEASGKGARLWRNTTHLIEVIMPRRPADKVFSFLP